MSPALDQLSRADLVFLRKALGKGQLRAPISDFALQAIGKSGFCGRLGALQGAPHDTVLALLDDALAEAPPSAAQGKATAAPTLVWGGPPVASSPARSTTAVLRDLFAQAKSRVLIAGFEFNHGAKLFAPLYEALRDRGVGVTICIHVDPVTSPNARVESHLAAKAHAFIRQNWPFGAPFPQVFYWAEAVKPGAKLTLHAKCVVVDGERVMLGSANFTHRGHKKNIEAGVLLEDGAFAKTLAAQFSCLIDTGVLRPLSIAQNARVALPEDEDDEDEADRDSDDPKAFAAITCVGDLRTSYPSAQEMRVDPEAVPLYERLMALGLATPVVGEDIEDGNGQVIGTAELAWPQNQVAVLLSAQGTCRRRLVLEGWRCYGVDVAGDEFVRLRDDILREH